MKAFSVIGECAEKSELVRRLVVVELTGRGLRVSTIKRVSDAVDLERPGSGTWKHRAAGAEEVMLASASRFVRFRRSSYPKMESSKPTRTGPCWPWMTPWCWPSRQMVR